MSKVKDFGKNREQQTRPLSGEEITGAFECNSCPIVSTVAIHNRQEGKIYWVCSDGHSSSINFKL